MATTLLTETERKRLLEIVHESIASYINDGRRKNFTEDQQGLLLRCGAFVTLKIMGSLRGCIGNFVSHKPLYQLVADLAIESSTRDPRFPPVASEEVPKLEVEISVLSPLKTITDVSEIVVGTHGIFITKGYHRGVLLPQVATEYEWDRETFLAHTCLKAGLPGDSWRHGAEIQIFSAEIFGDHDLG